MAETKCNCGKELVYDETRRCHHCPTCRPRSPKLGKPVLKPDEDRVREIMAEMLEPINKAISTINTELAILVFNAPAKKDSVKTDNETKGWREKAKELDVPLYDHEAKKLRTKADVLVDIAEAKEKSNVDDSD